MKKTNQVFSRENGSRGGLSTDKITIFSERGEF